MIADYAHQQLEDESFQGALIQSNSTSRVTKELNERLQQ